MATDERQLAMLQTTDAEFRTWVAAMIDQLNDIGLTQTADTGQIDTATVAKPGAISTSMGYAIFRFNDTLQGTVPIYMKIEFGSTSGAATNPGIWVTFASATDGAGNTTGTSYRVRTAIGFNTGNSTVYPWRACYNATIGMFWANWNNAGSTGVCVALFRSCDILTEEPTGEAVASVATASGFTVRTHDIALGVAETSTTIGAFPYSLASAEPLFMHEGRIVACASSTMLDTGVIIGYPGILAVAANHLPVFQVAYATPYVNEYAYLHLGGQGPYNVAVNATNNDRAVLIWE